MPNPTTRAEAASKRILRMPHVEERTGLSGKRIYALIAQGDFPRQIPLGANSSGWLEHEIDAWIEARIALRDTHANPLVEKGRKLAAAKKAKRQAVAA